MQGVEQREVPKARSYAGGHKERKQLRKFGAVRATACFGITDRVDAHETVRTGVTITSNVKDTN